MVNMALVAIVRVLLFAGIAVAAADGDGQFYEEGYVVKTVLDGNKRGLAVYSIFPDMHSDESVMSLDSTKSTLVKLHLPLSQSSEVERIAGSPEGQVGYRDGRLTEALFNHPKNLALDDDGNIYIADTKNLAIRKLSKAGLVTTIAGGSNKTGHSDGGGMEATFSNDFDVTYLHSSCSLIIADRGNRMIRQIQLPQVDGLCPGANHSAPQSNLTLHDEEIGAHVDDANWYWCLCSEVFLLLGSGFVLGMLVTIAGQSRSMRRMTSSLCWVNSQATTGGLVSSSSKTVRPSSNPLRTKGTSKTPFSAMRNAAAEFLVWGPALVFEIAIGVFETCTYLVLYCMSLPLVFLLNKPVHTPVKKNPQKVDGMIDFFGTQQVFDPQQTCHQERPSTKDMLMKDTWATISGLGRNPQVTNSNQGTSEASSLILNDLIDFSEPANRDKDQSFTDRFEKEISATSEDANEPRMSAADNESKRMTMVQKCLLGLDPSATTADLSVEQFPWHTSRGQ